MSGQQVFDKPTMLMGLVALIASGLYFLDLVGAVEVDELVILVSLWVGLAVAGLVRSAVRLRQRLNAGD